jgi:hypothetical protein
MKNSPLLLVVIATLCAMSAWAAQPSFEGLWREATRAQHSRNEFSDFTLIRSADGLVYHYFTKAGHPAHPAVVKRTLSQNGEAWTISEEGWSFGSKASQPAMKRWIAQFEELDRRMAEEIKRRR